jgi:hypothetical protein
MQRLIVMRGAPARGAWIGAFAALASLGAGCGALDAVVPFKEASGYADSVIPAVVGSWNAAAFRQEASPDLLQSAPNDRIDALFTTGAQQFGPLKEYRPAACNVRSVTSGGGSTTNSSCTSTASFERGDATIAMQARREGNGPWRITGFRVQPASLSLGNT